ncbi:MAG: gluconate 2-dehydrogenase subunit 3 family protein [Bryobacteraceae bacterium]|jgi:gluconate 2-dehydrogenase gamma chain
MPLRVFVTNRSKPPRRKFLGLVVTAAASAATVSCGGSRRPWRFLSSDEALTLSAVSERIIPTDQYAGAAGAGVVAYIDRQLNGPYRRFRKIYRQGLMAIDSASAARFSRRFAELTAEQADQLLKELEAGKLPPAIWDPAQAKSFFNLVVAHTMQGFYGDPRHGGNTDAVSWRMLGVPPLPLRGRWKYERPPWA